MGRQLLPKTLQKIAPKGRGVIQNSVTGIGTAAILQIGDSFVGSPAQSFGFVLPFLGIRLSLIDIINYMIHAGGLTFKKGALMRGGTAILASKFAQGAVSLGGVSALSATGSTLGAPGASAGIPGGGL